MTFDPSIGPDLGGKSLATEAKHGGAAAVTLAAPASGADEPALDGTAEPGMTPLDGLHPEAVSRSIGPAAPGPIPETGVSDEELPDATAARGPASNDVLARVDQDAFLAAILAFEARAADGADGAPAADGDAAPETAGPAADEAEQPRGFCQLPLPDQAQEIVVVADPSDSDESGSRMAGPGFADESAPGDAAGSADGRDEGVAVSDPVEIRVQFGTSDSGWRAFYYFIKPDGLVSSVMVVASYDEPAIAAFVAGHADDGSFAIADTGWGWSISGFPLELSPPVPDAGTPGGEFPAGGDEPLPDPVVVVDPVPEDPPAGPPKKSFLDEYREFLGQNPEWAEENGAGGIQLQVVTPSTHLPWIELGTPGAAKAFDAWYEMQYLAIHLPDEGPVSEVDPWPEVIICIFPGIDDLLPPGPGPVLPEGVADESAAVVPDVPVEAPAEGGDAAVGYWLG